MIIDLKGVKKIYNRKSKETMVVALKGISLSIERGEFVAIMGASGSGKSTLMNIIGCLDVPTEGKYFLEGVDVLTLSRNELAEIRNKKIGFVFQSFNLLVRFTAYDNVKLPFLYSKEKYSEKEINMRVTNALELVGLKERKNHFPNQLSGGEQQRIAIARALVNNPSIILADEPTGNLDSKRSNEIMELFKELNNAKITVILVTHEHDIASYAKRLIEIKDGEILRDVNQ